MITASDMERQIRESLTYFADEFDVSGIVRALVQRYGLTDIDAINRVEYWHIVERHNTGKASVMTEAQRQALALLCERYGVAFDESHYWHRGVLTPDGYVEGWLGGPDSGATYVGCDRDGRISS